MASAGPYEDGRAAFERRDYATALKLLKPLAEQGHADAELSLGMMYDNGQGVPQDYAEAMKWYRKAADQGGAGAQAALGDMYGQGRFGQGGGWAVPTDFVEAAKWYRKAADQGLAGAQAVLGFMYLKERGVPQDYAEAMKWYRKAADQGHAVAQVSLGLMYEMGQGVPTDYVEAVRWYRKAADQGYAVAQYYLGVIYDNGTGVPQDYAEAMKWYRKAADQGIAEAQYNLGVIYDNGSGVPQDYVQAHKWFSLAADRGDEDAVQHRDQAAAKMTPAQIAEAQRLAREWKPAKTKADPPPQIASTNNSSPASVPMTQEHGIYVVPVLINNKIELNFIVDSGATDVTIPADVVRTMIRSGTLTEEDFGAKRTYILADGSRVESRTFRIRSLKVGDRVVENVMGSEAHVAGQLLLGQSFLGKFKSWSIDNTKHALVLEWAVLAPSPPSRPPTPPTTPTPLRAGSVCLNRTLGSISGSSAGFRLPRSAVAG